MVMVLGMRMFSFHCAHETIKLPQSTKSFYVGREIYNNSDFIPNLYQTITQKSRLLPVELLLARSFKVSSFVIACFKVERLYLVKHIMSALNATNFQLPVPTPNSRLDAFS